MKSKFSSDYISPDKAKVLFPSLRFYVKLVSIIWKAGKKSRKGDYTGDDWIADSTAVGEAMESVGVKIHVEGTENILAVEGPCVIISNHMSTLETMLLPGIIQSVKDATFVVKNSLMRYPAMGDILKARDAIGVGRVNPREDLQTVLTRGEAHLKNGRSVILFPQGTRQPDVKAEDFSSLGEKLARRAQVPIVPIALKTDAWGTGRLVKDFGKIDPDIPVHVAVGKAMAITGNGKEEHARCMEFILEKYREFCSR
ncbi:MAG: 1-acyl-sn-glycerol-3-phosphate acyltransferase [Mailhella sp.]|nr:1-acyl-sn-glycerol-3-phosphate acyltransferase [Mailhella sp.]